MISLQSIARELGCPEFLYRVGDVEERYVVEDGYCDDTSCDGGEVAVRLIRADDPTQDLAVRVDLKDGRAHWGAGLAPDKHALAQAFVRDQAALRVLDRRRQLARAWALSRRRVGAGERRGAEARMYALGELDPRGELYALPFELEGTAWAVVDGYCVAPTCSCQEAVLSFCRQEAGTAAAKEQFAVRLDLSTGGACQALTRAPLSSGQSRALGALREELGTTWRDELAVRRRLARAIATGRLKPVVRVGGAAVRAGRSDRYPWGSSKEYRRCCARLDVQRL